MKTITRHAGACRTSWCWLLWVSGGATTQKPIRSSQIASKHYVLIQISTRPFNCELSKLLPRNACGNIQLRRHSLVVYSSQRISCRQVYHAESSLERRAGNVGHDHTSTDGRVPGAQQIFPKGKNSVPGLLHEGMLRADVRFALDDVQTSAPDPLFAQRLRERIRVDERAARGVDEHGMLLHLAQKARVDDVPRRVAARREHEQHVALPRELVQADAPDGPQRVARHERRFELVVARRGRVRGVDAVRDAERGEARERRLRDAPEAQKAHGAGLRGRGGAQLRPSEEERSEREVGPLMGIDVQVVDARQSRLGTPSLL